MGGHLHIRGRGASGDSRSAADTGAVGCGIASAEDAGSIRGDVKEKHFSLAGQRDVFWVSSPVWGGDDVCATQSRRLCPFTAKWKTVGEAEAGSAGEQLAQE